jgi:hypothetical protein
MIVTATCFANSTEAIFLSCIYAKRDRETEGEGEGEGEEGGRRVRVRGRLNAE